MSEANVRLIPTEHELPLPPDDLAIRVGGQAGEEFRESGRMMKQCLLKSLPEEFDWRNKRILDFGCGIGRTLRHFAVEAHDAEIWGCDIDGRSIDWLRRSAGHLFKVFENSLKPKLDLPTNYFDLIYCISVFTHMPKHWDKWLEELRRILAPGGILLCTFHERTAYEYILHKPFKRESVGMQKMRENQTWDKGGPFVFHSNWWIIEYWSKVLPIDYIVSDGMLNWQNIAAMHKPTDDYVRPTSAVRIIQPFPYVEWRADFLGNIDYDVYAPKSWLIEHGIVAQGSAGIQGWFTSSRGPVSQIDFYVDGMPVHPRVLRLQRPDVQRAHPKMPFGIDSGFKALVDISDLLPGPHPLTIVAHDKSGRNLRAEAVLFRKIAVSLENTVSLSPIQYHLEDVNSDYLDGWVFSSEGLDSIEIQADGTPVGTSMPTPFRPDVEAAVPGATGPTGFHFNFPAGVFRSRRPAIRVVFKQKRGAEAVSETVVIPNLNDSLCATLVGNNGSLSPLPLPIHRILCQLRGEEIYSVPWTEELIKQAVDDLAFIVQRGPRHLRDLYHYLGFLKLIWAKYDFILHHFPKFNESAASRKDSLAIASSISEMFSIAHYLYVLKSRGCQGHFAEFGCFKGFSTSMLSEACFQLGIPLHVFDSFAGLPPSESDYYRAGEFMGSLGEVQRNVSAFGKIEAVTFHPGFFADTLAKSDLQPMCIWMDVDLESSSRDVMTILGRLPLESCLFSHECCQEYFPPTGIAEVRGPDSVIGPILDAFRKNERQITGTFISGNMGAFWDRNRGIPVMPVNELIRIKDLGRF
jgi:O-methyltransferase